MNTFDDNWKWELEGANRGADNFWTQQDNLRESGQGEQTVTSQSILRQRVLEVAASIKATAEKKGAGRASPFNAMLKIAATRINSKGEPYQDYNILAYIALSIVLQEISRPDKRKQTPLTALAARLGTNFHYDAKYYAFEIQYPGYYHTVMKSMKEQNVSSSRHIHRTLQKKCNDFDFNWADWSEESKVKIGVKVLAIIIKLMPDLFFVNTVWSRGKSTNVLDTTPAFDDWIGDNEHTIGELKPMFLPMLVPPRDWIQSDRGDWIGGYYTQRITANLPFVKTRSDEHRDFVRKNPPIAHVNAINKLQKTAWGINERMLEVLRESIKLGKFPADIPQYEAYEIPTCTLPPDLAPADMTEEQLEVLESWKAEKKWLIGRDKTRQSKLMLYSRAMAIAEELKGDPYYFVYTCDFRGRIYCATPGFSPQGADPIKGMLRFNEAKRCGEDGLFWLAVNIANKYGYDKEDYEDRVQWVEDHEQEIRAVATDPLGAGYSFASDADKPFQFIASCIEWAESEYGCNPEYKSRLPIGLDGSCNGLQHYSALLRDEVGAEATNVIPTQKPEDIYQRVADVAVSRIQHIDSEEARAWIRAGVNRKVTKRPVMTLPYGATRQSCRQYLADYIMDNIERFGIEQGEAWNLAKWMTPHVWGAIGDVVIAAREGMDWLQKAAREQVKRGCITWLTPKTYFPVYQPYVKTDTVRIYTQLNGDMNLTLRKDTPTPSPYRQTLGIAPNFVHAQDSTHMVMTINGVDDLDLAMIHDDYGTHAGDTEVLFQAIRTQFVRLYWTDNLQWWASQMNLPNDFEPMPQKGNMYLPSVLESEYFFG